MLCKVLSRDNQTLYIHPYKIITNNEYPISLGKRNYKAACSLPMEDITDMYLEHFAAISTNNAGVELVGNI